NARCVMTSRHAISISVLVCAACSATPDERVGQTHEGITSGDIYNFGALTHPGSCMDVRAAGTANGSQIQEYACNGTGAQSFTVEDAGGGAYKLVGTPTGKCV